jgi:hypothetical protein
MEMRSGCWNVRHLCRSGYLKTVSRELTEHALGLVAVQEVKWDKDGTEPADYRTFLVGCADQLQAGDSCSGGLSSYPDEAPVPRSQMCLLEE